MAQPKDNRSRRTLLKVSQFALISLCMAWLGYHFWSSSDQAIADTKQRNYELNLREKADACGQLARVDRKQSTEPPSFLRGTTLSGEPAKVEANKWTVINFWATWCKTCRNEKPSFLRFARRADDVQILSVVTGQGTEHAPRLMTNAPFPVIVDAAQGEDIYGTNGANWGITGVPETFIIDPEGNLRHHFVGPQQWTRVAKYMRQCYADEGFPG